MHTASEQALVIRDMGDAMNECRRYTEERLTEVTGISIDRLSTRENNNEYDVYLNITDGHQRGYVQCQVSKKEGLGVTYHAVRDFEREQRYFAG
ncbi:hypothetical protein [Bacterioplanes sanyensis]|uniref:hypothetical protein n=1 Tax=Bacterioplanes sanyensis TaxID=1249553 RepID=UPI0012FD32A5|nr:hypothetical protein [Bacterioplanes sanyensis]